MWLTFLYAKTVIKGDFNMFYFSRLLVGLLMCFGQNMYPCIPLCPSFFHLTPPLSFLQQGTDERSKVSPVEEAAFCRSHASASLHTYTHRIHYIPVGYGGETQLGAITGALQAHTCSPGADESDTPATSDPFCVLRNHHQHTLSWRILRTLLL